MVLTNALLGICFTVVSNFVATVDLPPGIAPAGTQDVARFHCGFRYAPTDTYLALADGNEFWINHGVVQSYLSPTSHYLHGDPHPPKQSPPLLLSSNQTFELAHTILKRLSKSSDSNVGAVPAVNTYDGSDGTKGAFYRFAWPMVTPHTSANQCAAVLEMDARLGRVTHLALYDTCFFDYDSATEISNRVYMPEPPPKPAPALQKPRPTPQEVETGIGSWMELCKRVGFEVGQDTNVASVNWDATYVLGSKVGTPLCRVRFKDGAGFDAQNGSICLILYGDSCYRGSWGNQGKGYWGRFQGRINWEWETLADRLEEDLVSKVGLSKEVLAPLTREPAVGGLERNTTGLTRVLVEWGWKQGKRMDFERTAFAAEFDVESGKLKLLSFRDEEFRRALRSALAKPETKSQEEGRDARPGKPK